MGLTVQSTGVNVLQDYDQLLAGAPDEIVVALAGNPNTGKSTVFNSLTGLKQHTGNWPGKTVTVARGRFRHRGRSFLLVDLPGTYSLLANSVEEEVARDFILYARPAVVVAVADATCLERNLNLVLQILEITPRVVLCVNLMDEAERKRIRVDLAGLSAQLGVPAVGTNARDGTGLRELRDAVLEVAAGAVKTTPRRVHYPAAVERAAARLEALVQEARRDTAETAETRAAAAAAEPGAAGRWAALRLLEGERCFLEKAALYLGWEKEASEKLARAAEAERAALLSLSLPPRTVALSPPGGRVNSDGFAGRSPEAGSVGRPDSFLGPPPGSERAAWAGAAPGSGPPPARNDGTGIFGPVSDWLASSLVREAEEIGRRVVRCGEARFRELDRKIDDVVTSRLWGIPIMVLLLGAVFWITVTGSNYPSEALSALFFRAEGRLNGLIASAGWPEWLHGLLVLGVFRTLAWVVSVMLPPMAIFFPLFTLLEDLGYLPRVAFNLDNFFKKARAHGKQALTMCMGFGCNAAGVIACRIIDSPRERLIAVLTNNFVPCNGRFPILIALAGIFIAGEVGAFQSAGAAATVLGAVILGVAITLAVSKLLSHTLLKGLPSSFILELPPYRKPQVGRVLVRSLLDRTLFVLGRAAAVAAPAGVVIWLAANIEVGGVSLLDHGARFLDPFAHLLGMDGYILTAFILGLPANEIVIPLMIMSYLTAGSMLEMETLEDLRRLFTAHGWTWLTALCTMLFALNHFPCGTTLLTIRKETGSWKWTAAAFAIPTVTGIAVCFAVAQGARLLGLV